MANLTPKQASEVLRLMVPALEQAMETEQAIAIIDLEGDIKQAVFYMGVDANGQQIGIYSTDEMYVSIKGARDRWGSQLPTSRLKGRGRNSNKAKFKNGNPRKSMYFSDGYSGFRAYMGRAVDKVNLNLTGNLSNSISSGSTKNVSTVSFLNTEQAELASHLEKKYGVTIFAASNVMVERLVERLTDAATKAFNSLLP